VDDLEEIVGGEAEVGGGCGELAGGLLSTEQAVFAGGADEGAGAAAGLDEAGFLELAVGTGDGVHGEAEIGAVVPGQLVTIHCDGCGTPIAARITRIATQAEYTPPVIYSRETRTKLVYMIEARTTPEERVANCVVPSDCGHDRAQSIPRNARLIARHDFPAPDRLFPAGILAP